MAYNKDKIAESIDMFQILTEQSKQTNIGLRLKTILNGRVAILKYLKIIDKQKEKTAKTTTFKKDLENIAFMLNEWSILDNENISLKNENQHLKMMVRISDSELMQSQLFNENLELKKENDNLKAELIKTL